MANAYMPQQYMDANAAAYVQNAPRTPVGMGPMSQQPQQAQRRGASEMSGGQQDLSGGKRQRMNWQGQGGQPGQQMSAPMRQ